MSILIGLGVISQVKVFVCIRGGVNMNYSQVIEIKNKLVCAGILG